MKIRQAVECIISVFRAPLEAKGVATEAIYDEVWYSSKATWVYYTCVSLLLHAPAFAYARTHTCQSITVTGNDAGYSPPSSVLHAGLYG